MNLVNRIKEVVSLASGIDASEIGVEHPELLVHGDYSCNVALVKKGGRKLAEEIASKIEVGGFVEKVEVAGAGFINFWINKNFLVSNLDEVSMIDNAGASLRLMVEYAHPNTHKEMHIGHMRTLITGEALARLLDSVGHKVFRANYQGDIGPHVAKAIWGTQKILGEMGVSFEEYDGRSSEEKAHLLGEGYVRGNKQYEENKAEIDALNSKLYRLDKDVKDVYELTRKWSLDYYEQFYNRFGTKFDKLFFESRMAEPGKKMVEDNVGPVFERSQGAIIFDGEKYGLHKRVFITEAGNPTYEGKEVANAKAEREVFEFDKKIHVVANEQAGYFEVVFKAIEMMDSWFVGRQVHLSMGMVTLVGRKMSSRTGEIVTVDGLIDEVKQFVGEIVGKDGNRPDANVLEAVALGAIKYSVLKTHPTQNTVFDLKQSVSLEGNSGPYLQYTYARGKSVINKFQTLNPKHQVISNINTQNYDFYDVEVALLRYLYRFSEVVNEAALRLSPNLLCNYLYEVAQKYNTFYNQCSILGAETEEQRSFRLQLTQATTDILESGLRLLGIKVLERM